jgi:uncharacterized protein
MYDTTIPFIIHGLKSTAALLRKAQAHCADKNIKPEALLDFRLYPDMFAFTRQVQFVSDFAKGIGARLSGTENPKYADEEKSFDELQARIAKTIAFLEGLDRKLFDGATTRLVKVRVSRDEEKEMTGAEYLGRYALPNFYFHMATAYNILRHNGVELGKSDFLGRNI